MNNGETEKNKAQLYRYINNNEMLDSNEHREKVIGDLRAIKMIVGNLTVEELLSVFELIHIEAGGSLTCPMCGKVYDESYRECDCEEDFQ